MIFEIREGRYAYRVSTDHCYDLSIPMAFDGRQPNLYNVPRASSRAFEDEQFIGDTRRGGSCNFEAIRLIPHCNGTHTECAGHLSLPRIPLPRVVRESFHFARVVTVIPEKANDTEDEYAPAKNATDTMITRRSLERAWQLDELETPALVIRTLPNDESKKWRNYMEQRAPFFSLQAMDLIVTRKIRHLLVDLPSLDRTFDEGRLSAHHIFWEIPQGQFESDEKNHSMKTITEMIYVDESVADGCYLLELQVPRMESDAAPSRPLLYPIERIS